MVGLALTLRLRLLRNGLRGGRGSTQRVLGLVLGAVAGGALALIGFTALAAGRGRPALATDVGVILFTLMAAGWVVLPILTFGSDDLLDPTKLSLLPLSRRQLMTLLSVGSLVGVAPLATLLAALGLAVGVAAGPGQVLTAVAAAVLEVAFCVVLSRVVAAALSGLLRSRRGRDLGIAVTMLVALSFQLLNLLLQYFARRPGGVNGTAAGVAGPLRWTPPGMLASAPLLVQQGRPLAALGLLAVVTALVVAGVALWERLAARSMVTVDASGSRRRRATRLTPAGVGWLLPSGRAGAVAAKDLRYLGRDSRRGISQLVGVLLPALALVFGPALALGTRPGEWAVFVVCFIAAFAALPGGNRFGVDGSSIWMLLGSQTDPRDSWRDLRGGDLATLVVNVPLIVVVGLSAAALTGGWFYLPPALGLAAALLLVITAGSGAVAVRAPYAVPDNPRNAFSSGAAGQGCAAGLLSMVLLLAGFVSCLPLLALLLPALQDGRWGWALLGAGPAYGVLLGALARRVAAREWARRGPEVLQVLSTSRS